MADFGYLSDTDDSAVDELISQVKDLSVLEQVSKINSSGFTDSLLPPDLDSRFNRLKSFPLSTPKTLSNGDRGPQVFSASDKVCPCEKERSLEDEMEIFLDTKQNLDRKFKESPSGDDIFSALEENPDGLMNLKKKHKNGSLGFPLGSSNSSSMGSPPKKTGCFWCSPKKKVSKKKNKDDFNMDWSNYNKDDGVDDFLSDLNSFSYKEQEKILKKAMEEEEKISKEAEKIVKWAKQASNRMSFSGIEDDTSDDDKRKL